MFRDAGFNILDHNLKSFPIRSAKINFAQVPNSCSAQKGKHDYHSILLFTSTAYNSLDLILPDP